jgi:hypothetical protein
VASLPVMDVLPNIIYPSEAFLPISLLAMDLLENYVPFVGSTEATSDPLWCRRIEAGYGNRIRTSVDPQRGGEREHLSDAAVGGPQFLATHRFIGCPTVPQTKLRSRGRVSRPPSQETTARSLSVRLWL